MDLYFVFAFDTVCELDSYGEIIHHNYLTELVAVKAEEPEERAGEKVFKIDFPASEMADYLGINRNPYGHI